MNKITLTTLLAISIVACSDQNPDKPTVTPSKGTKSKINLQVREFVQQDSSNYILFPLSAGENINSEGLIESSREYKDMANDSWNIIFYNSKTGEQHLLDENKKMLIHSYGKNSYGREQAYVKDKIFYNITAVDYNGDNKFDYSDPSYLFISDLDGHHFRQLSPDNYNLVSWELVKNTNTILMILVKDSNNDKKFDDKDEKVAMSIDFTTNAPAKEIFSGEFKDKLKELFDKNWKRKK